MPEVTGSVHGPYEDLGIAALNLVGKIIDSQPPETKKILWDSYIEDMKAWREFWKNLAGTFKIG